MAYQTYTPRNVTRFKLWMWGVALIVASGLLLAISQLSNGFIHTLPIWGLWVLPGLLLLRYGFKQHQALKAEVVQAYQRLVTAEAFQPVQEVDLGSGRKWIVAADNDKMVLLLPLEIHRFQRADIADWKIEPRSARQHKTNRVAHDLHLSFQSGEMLDVKRIREHEAVTNSLQPNG
ncbi:MAG: hypothetical protein ACP5D0_04125 [Hydrogenovibrio sp.]